MIKKRWLSSKGASTNEQSSLPSRIVMTASMWEKLYSHLIRVTPHNPYPNEEHAFLLASVTTSPLGTRFLVCEMIPAQPTDFVRQSPTGLELDPVFVTPVIQRCRREGWSLIEVHSHPFDSSASTTFSQIDWPNDRVKMPAFAETLRSPFMHATMVVGQHALDAHVYDRSTGRIVPIDEIVIVGNTLVRKRTTSTRMSMRISRTQTHDDRYARQERLVDQECLRELTVAIVGLGGLGSFVALELAHLGVGRLVLVDPDRVERKNLNRLMGATDNDIGQYKVAVYERQVRAIAKDVQVVALPLSLLDRENAAARDYVKGADILVGCVDNDGARFILNQIAVRYLIPLIDGGSGIELTAENALAAVGGQVQVVLPGAGCLECRGHLNAQQVSVEVAPPAIRDDERAHGYGTHEGAPSVVFLNGVVASLQVAELLFLCSPARPGATNAHPMSMYSALQRKVTPVITHANEYCPTCAAEAGRVGIGDLAPIVFESDEPGQDPFPEAKEG